MILKSHYNHENPALPLGHWATGALDGAGNFALTSALDLCSYLFVVGVMTAG
jgi:hypothetical protein